MKTKNYKIHKCNYSDFGKNSDYGKLNVASNNREFTSSEYQSTPLLPENPKKWISPKYGVHPGYVTQMCLIQLTNYWITNDVRYLDICKIKTNYLINEMAIEDGDQLWYPYNFDFPLFSNPKAMKKPWYSGMQQGEALSLLCRLYNETKDNSLLEAARKTFNTFDTWKDKNERWISCITDDNHYWVEEYPHNEGPVCYTLNGFIFAVCGLYDYYILTNDAKCKELLQAAIYTIEKRAHLYLNNKSSYYCLSPLRPSGKYHRLHTNQMMTLYKMTQDPLLLDLYKQFAKRK